MAYNPFDFFRRNQKILFAVLTVFIMIMFTLSSGAANDFFQWFPRWLGTRSSGEVLANVDGSKVRSSELDEIRRHRRLANLYMIEARGRANMNLAKQLDDLKGKVSEPNRAAVAEFIELRRSQYIGEQMRRLLEDPQFAAMGDQIQRMLAGTQRNNIDRMKKEMGRIATANNPKPDDQSAAMIAQTLLTMDTTPASASLYFLTAPNENLSQALDFHLWRKKADQLGIRFTREDVQRLIDEEFLRQFDKEAQAALLKEQVEDKRGTNPAVVYDYLADEFRVRAAQQSVLGAAFIRAAAAAPTSPDQAFATYKEETNLAKYTMIPLPVDNFLPQVAGEPTDKEITDLFRKGQNLEADPLNPRIALKKPRELKVGYLEITAKEPYYVAAAAETVAKADKAAKLSQLLTVPFGGGALGSVAAVGVNTLPADAAALGEYEQYKKDQKELLTSKHQPRSAFDPLAPVTDAHLYGVVTEKDKQGEPRTHDLTRQNAAVMVGLGAAGPLTLALPAQLRAESHDNTRRFTSQSLALARPLIGGLGDLATVVGIDTVIRPEFPPLVAPAPLPPAAVRTNLMEKAKTDLQTRKLPREDMIRLMEDTDKAVRDNPDKVAGRAAAKKIIDAFVAVRKLTDLKQVGGSTDFADRFTIGKDVGLDPLRKRLDGPHAGLTDLPAFGKKFFTQEITDPRTGRVLKSQDNQSFFLPQLYPAENGRFSPLGLESQFLVWLTDERSAESPRKADVPEVRAKIVQWWKLQKARELAQRAADELAEKTGKLSTDAAKLRPELEQAVTAFAAEKKLPRLFPFTMPDIAAATVLPAGKENYEFSIPQIQQEPNGGRFVVSGYPWPKTLVPNPTPKMLIDMLQNRNKPLATSFVSADQPENTILVFVLTDRTSKEHDEFFKAVYAPANREFSQAAQALGPAITADARRKAYKEAIDLLKAEFACKDESAKLTEKPTE